MSRPFIEVDHVSKQFKKNDVFSNLSFSLKEGEVLSLVGPSGTGKSTLLRCLAGIEAFTSGEVLIEGNSILQTAAKDRPIGMVFQQALLFPHLTILENVTYGLRLHTAKREAVIEGLKYLKLVGLEDYKNEYPHALSGGQQQRVSLVRALILKPKLLLLDEPFSSLDPELRRELRGWVKELLRKENTTSIFVTHDREEAMLLGDRVAVLAEGVIQQQGRPKEVYDHPVNRLVARLYSDAFVLDHDSYCLTEHLEWLSEKQEGYECFQAEWVNDTYQHGQRYAHIRLSGDQGRYVIPVPRDQSVNTDQTGFIGVPLAFIKRFE
ncbi:ABC transporter ATP-binding protein [Jeotgalibacillus sp. R-1-5s-1]|uniref:ABC transporter ATP-binding protein n=1 Tax=Jeotgalibacillus sp. R-1-5s-1 TaxID=2555897 RepID=UPI00106CBAF3|nr:ABC transporter ATP-binding protein [Jeotgalibacillus sp. R-1-5s-1]TFD98298.1 ABC transporter ATP-binding protein [Jeotgalibacillus sp. R-1-5s-1]